MDNTRRLPAGMEALTVEAERQEIRAALQGSPGHLRLKQEKPQRNYRLVNDEPQAIGWLEMFTILDDWYDELGRNRKGSTFGLEGLAVLGIDPAQCQIERGEP